jgi:FMN-dependent NADH-azoreductase
MKLLYINGNPKKVEKSFGRQAGSYYVENFEGDVDVVNVYEDIIPLIDNEVLTGWTELGKGTSFEQLDESTKTKIGRMNEVLEQFLKADQYLFVSPLWNLGVPPMLKAYIDNILIAGKTFKYTNEGPKGLLSNKKATVIQASGGIYSSEKASKSDYGINYLVNVLSFIGVDDIDKVYVEGTAMNDGDTILKKAYFDIDMILKKNNR